MSTHGFKFLQSFLLTNSDLDVQSSDNMNIKATSIFKSQIDSLNVMSCRRDTLHQMPRTVCTVYAPKHSEN
jgi:hypothetical protein